MPTSEPMVPWAPAGRPAWEAQFVPISQRLMRDRILLLGNFLDEEQTNRVLAILLYLQKEDPEKQIDIYVNVPGALLKPTFALYDTIRQLSCPVMTVNMGLATGMAAFLCGAGTKGKRYAFPNARFLLQKTGLDDPYQGQATDIGLKVADNIRDNHRVAAQLADMTGQTTAKIEADLERDFYLSAFEAREYGLIDKVLLPTQKLEVTNRIPLY